MINIGIATSPFIQSFQKAFGQEIEIVKPNPSLEEIHKYDLIIFSGGEDISPRFYGENITYTRGVNIMRDKIESDIFSKTQALNIKVFGVCRGHQLINAKLGGRLLQDLYMGQKPSLHHSSPHRLEKLSPDRFLESISVVNSLHHQGVVVSGKGLQSTSRHKGVIESSMGKNIYTVQFHPEFMLGIKEIRKFFTHFSKYVGENIKKLNPSDVNFKGNFDDAFLKKYGVPRPNNISERIESGNFEATIGRTGNIDEYLHCVKAFSSLADTQSGLQLNSEQYSHVENLYRRKNELLIEFDSLNERDEDLYLRLENNEYSSDAEADDYINERDDISDIIEGNQNEVSRIRNALITSARELRDTINNNNFPSNDFIENSVSTSAINSAATFSLDISHSSNS